jgi:signal transduction histidine kinase/ActR/RegA family two-component response regulator
MVKRIPLQFDYYYPTWNRWYENRVYPIADGIAILCAEISDRKQIEQEREQLLASETEARAKAEELNRLKDEFLAIVSHELRTPLNPILGWSQLLSAGKLNPDRTAQGIATIKRNAKLQAQLIEDLLDVSRILRDKIKLNKTLVDLKQVIQAAIATVQLMAEAKSILITTKFEPNVGLVLGDSGRLQQIVWNLLSNAIKFTPEGGQVTVTLSSNDKSAIIEVQDTGQGIEPEFLPYIFDRFRQADSASTRNFGGLGLGLAIVKHLTELHDGAIAVSSPGEGQGSTFTVELPLAHINTKMPPDPIQDNSVQSKKLTGIRVLAVDDEADSLSLIAFILEQEGADVTTATSATEALEILSQSTFELLISDIGMPEIDGYELMRQIRSMPSVAAIRAIALTAYAGGSDRQQAREAGFQEHIAKPLDVNTLVNKAIELMKIFAPQDI